MWEPSRKPQMEQAQTQQVKNSMMNPKVEPVMDHGTLEPEKDEVWPLCGKPYFDVIIGKGHIKPNYQFYVPVKMHSMLPPARVPVLLEYRGKSWKLVYYGDASRKRFDPSWKNFVMDNNLKAGDACVFELMECSVSEVKFTVQILRGDFPSELLARAAGETPNAPIEID